MARKQWRCFFCDEVFTRRQDAGEHFGCDASCEADIPACQIKAHEGHLITYIRKCEREIRRYQSEDSAVMRSIMALEGEQDRKLREADERGYAKGVEEMKAQGYCADPQAHSITKAA